MRRLRRVLVWSPEADQDLIEIWSYLSAEASAQVADKQLRRIDAVAQTLPRHPFRGRPRTEIAAGIRSVIAQPYIIFYRPTNTAVEVVRVLHGRRDIARIFAEGDEGRNPGVE